MKADRSRSGIALILVLMLVVLTTIIVIAFLGSIKTETGATRSNVGVQNSRQLADLAVQTVISQIQQATQSSSARQPGTYSWASQPGMIRVYDNSGKEAEWYKLYSAQTMTQTSIPAATTGTSSPVYQLIQSDLPEIGSDTTGNWVAPGSKNYGVFTDLNSPVIASDGTTLEYPIMDPSSATSVAKSSGTTTNAVLGFDIDTTNDPGFNSAQPSSATNNQAPMPVRWLYVLQDGTLVPAKASGTAGTITVTGASSTNPVVGRVAFWTDDDTCKLNINTAADGTYYDTPRFSSSWWKANVASETPPTQDNDIIVDQQMAMSPPVANEFQRYIGNPAQTRLSYVLGNSVSGSGMVNKSHLLTLLSPFMQWGGSNGGTITTWGSTTNPLTTPMRQTPYATLDEWMFSTALNSAKNRVASPGDITGSPPPLLTNTRLQQLRFFLSANSDAPEVNLFGQPRISMWPVFTANLATNALPSIPNPYVTTFDQLIANAATLTGSTATPRAPGNTPNRPNVYYFGRQNAASPTADWNNYSANVFSQTTASSNTRNQNIFAFLEALSANPVPGYGFDFDTKYSRGEMDQILTEVFDYCRSLNPSDLLLANATTNFTYASTGAGTGTWGVGQVTPICIPSTDFGGAYSTQGFGRFDSISDIAIDFTKPYFTYNTTSTVTTGTTTTTSTITNWSDTDTNTPANNLYTGVIYLGLNSPAVGYPFLDPHIRVVVQAPNQPSTLSLTITTDDGQTHSVFGTPANAANTNRKVYSFIPLSNPPDGGNNGWNNGYDGALLWGGAVGARQCLLNKRATQDASTGTATFYSQNYMLCGLNMSIPATCKKFSMPDLPLEIKIYHTNAQWSSTGTGDGFDGSPGDLVQDITVTIPGFSNFPLPTNGSGSTLEQRLWWSGYGPQNTNYSYIVGGDIVQSLVAGYNGDSRLIAAQHVINDNTNSGSITVGPSRAFVRHPLDGTSSMAHSFWDIFPSQTKRYTMPGYTNPSASPSGTASLVTGAAYPSYVLPATGFIDSSQTGVTNVDPNLTGDWDNGWGHFSDGPYINKADEVGYQYYTQSGGTWYFGQLNNSGGGAPLYYDGGFAENVVGLSSPNRSVASPVMFGSLSTGVPLGVFNSDGTTYTAYATKQGPKGQAIPWQTLLFRPQAGHFGGSKGKTQIEDEQLLDWFWMPVVQPYAISTTLSTAGKVNMNYQIAPFTYLTRATALMGVLGSEYVISCPTSSATNYKTDSKTPYSTYRSPVKVLEDDGYTTGDTHGTLAQFKNLFATGEIFRSAAEICDVYLEPQADPSGTTQDWTNWTLPGSPSTSSDAETYWAKMKLTGDNTRERPYNGLYSRLTTKSNTYTVHVRAQSLKAPKGLADGTWVENPQLIVSEYRGSVTINRYLDPQDTNIPDFMTPGTNFDASAAHPTNPFKYSLDNYYKYRVLETRQFVP